MHQEQETRQQQVQLNQEQDLTSEFRSVSVQDWLPGLSCYCLLPPHLFLLICPQVRPAIR
jgi:hypothetical protein